MTGHYDPFTTFILYGGNTRRQACRKLLVILVTLGKYRQSLRTLSTLFNYLVVVVLLGSLAENQIYCAL
jgi:hypothetical protein